MNDASGADGTAGGLVELADVRRAADTLRGVARRTPLLPGELPDGGTVWLKCENLQHASAFKVRGAYNFVAGLDDRERAAGLVTYSSGNHAQGVAYAARAFGAAATIVMPEDAPDVKLRGTRRLGGEVVREGTTTTERRVRAERIAEETGATVVPPFDDPRVIAGQGTVALEGVEQLSEAAAVDAGAVGTPGLWLVPIGGGGLVSGHAAALRELARDCRVVGVEPRGAASMRRSLDAGEPVTIERVDTIADGLKPVRPADLTFRHVHELVDDVVLVDDEQIVAAVKWFVERRLVVEPSGAATVAALMAGAVEPPDDGDAVATVSGGNVDPGQLAGWLQEMEVELERDIEARPGG